jgi:hypothetical protein
VIKIKIKRVSLYRLTGSFHMEMVGAHLLRSWLATGVLEHLLHEFHQFVSFNVVLQLPGRILNPSVFPTGVHLFLQRSHSVGQLVGDHTDSS